VRTITIQIVAKFRNFFSLGRIAWLMSFLFLLCLAHLTNPNDQLIGNWLRYSKEIVGGGIPSENWYGPTASILMIPFMHFENFFFATLIYAGLGANFYWLITEKIQNHSFRVMSRIIPLFNLYFFRLLDSSGDTVFEFFLLTGFCYAILKNRWILFNIAGIALGELRSTYWIIYLGISLYLLFKYKRSRLARVKFLIVIPALISVLTLNWLLYGVFSTAGEGGYTAFFTNNKSSYLVGNSFMVDHFAFGEAGPMTRRCEGLDPCNDHQLFLKTAKENLEHPQAFAFNLLQKSAIYFFEPQKVPRIPGKFSLYEKEGFIKIEEQRLTTANLLASINYFLYRALLLISFWFLALYVLIRKFVLGSKPLENKLSYLCFPWLLGSITGILFVAETRLWIVMEMMLIPFICSLLAQVTSEIKARLVN
jgi:hypothetical protein